MYNKKTSVRALACLILGLALLLSAASVPAFAAEADLTALTEANYYYNLLKGHDNVAITVVWYTDGEADGSMFLYFTEEMFAEEAITRSYFMRDGLMLWIDKESAEETLFLYLDDEDFQADFRDTLLTETNPSMEEETLLSAETADGVLRVVTLRREPDELEYFAEEQGRELTEVDGIICRCEFDEETLELFTVGLSLKCGEEELLLQTVEYSYDTDYDLAASAFAAFADTEHMRRAAFTYAAGTDAERERTWMLPKNIPLVCLVDGDSFTEFFTDPACTQEYTGGDPDDYSDLHLYLPAVS